MSNQYSVILRATNNSGSKYDLELVDSPAFKLDISAIESGDIGKIFGISSQQFTLPGNQTNNQFFNNLFDLGTTPGVGLNRSVACQVLVDGQSVYTGKLYVIDVITDQYNDIIYNCAVVNETIDFRTLVQNRALGDLNWTAYNHTFNYANVSASWNNQLFSGSVFYPLINYGTDPNNSKSPAFELGGAKGMMDNASTPLQLTQFKPAIKAKTVLDVIFDNLGYKYTSSFINSAYFQSQYVLTTPNSNDGFSYINPVSQSLYAYQSTSQSIVTNTFTSMSFQSEVFDQGNNWNLANNTYTAKYDGVHQVATNISFSISNVGTPATARTFYIYYLVNNVFVKTIPTKLTSVAGNINTGYVPVTLKQFDVLRIVGAFTSKTNTEVFKTKTGQNNSWLSIIGPANPYGGTVNLNHVWDPAIKVIDYIQGLAEKFNLVIEPVKDQRNLLRIESFNDWVDQGVVVDWTDIVDRSVKFKITHPIGQQSNKIYFSDDIDDDFLNQYQKQTQANIYGGYNYLSDSDLSVGEKRIGGFFAATPVKGIPVKGTNGTTVLPWLCKKQADKYAEVYKFKTRLLFQQPIKTIQENEATGTVGGYSGYYYLDTDGAGTVVPLNYYRTLLATTDSPTNYSSSSDIHYTNVGYYPFQQSAVNGTCQDGLFNKFWAYYINELYDVDARKLTCNVKLNPADIQGIQLNDKIFIDGHYYRINKIKGANLINAESVEVELLKTAPRKLNFTGRRRISTPTTTNPNQFVDVIINSFNQQGSLLYQNFETGDIITDPAILNQVSTVDNFDFFEDQVVWNLQPITRTPMSVTVIGPNKYDETQQHVLAVGAGNDLSSNVYNAVVFGDNNTLNSAGESVNIMANDTTITDSNFVTLIQPSGSRIISGSSNNVFVNPINDINPSDPTGSVYTGNLINQGTADFKNGASMTGSVNITGSLCVNGNCYPFSTGSVAQTASYLSVYATSSQFVQGALTASVFQFEYTDFSRGITLVSGSRLTVPSSGAYNIAFSAQLDKTTGTNATAYIWLRKNGVDVPATNTSVTLGGGANDKAVAAWNLFVNPTSSCYYELAWTTDQTNTYLKGVPAVPGVFPAIPSIITTVNSMY